MRYFGAAVTDVGIKKETNQDSVCLKIGVAPDDRQVAMFVICDGMGGLAKGELASATVIRELEKWYMNKLPEKVDHFLWEEISKEWTEILKNLNQKILKYGNKNKVRLGTTTTAMLVIGDEYMIAHVGDSRVYRLDSSITQMTEDQTYVMREIKNGNMTLEEAAKDKRKHMLLQCVGASNDVEPEYIFGKIEPEELYLLCSDGFRHKLTGKEIYETFQNEIIRSVSDLENRVTKLINQVKERKEKDNISVVVFKCIG